MKARLLFALMVLSLGGGLNTAAFAQDAIVTGPGMANTGTQTFQAPVTIGLTAEQVRQLMGDVLQKDSLNAKESAEYKQQVGLLSKEIGVRKPAVENFLRILGEAKVPIEDLGSKLAEIAQRHKDMLDRWSVLEDDDDPAIRERTDAARAAIDDGDYDRADALLAEAEDMDLAAARQARAWEDKAKQAADRRFLSAAAKRAKRGELRLTRLDYPGAAGHFKAVVAMVPAGEELVRAGYLMREGGALDDAGKYWEAEKAVARALAIREKALGRDHPSVATTLNNLAALYDAQGRYAEVEPLYQRSLAIYEKALGRDHPYVATTLNNLAGLYDAQGRYAEAEPLYQRSLAIWEKALGRDHPSVATTLNNLAELYRAQGRYAEAEPLYQRSLAILEKALGPDHPNVAGSLNNLAELYRAQGRYAEAELLYQRSLAILEKALGPDHPNVASSLNNLAGLYQAQGRYADAEPLYQRSLGIREKALGPDHPDVATSLNNLALLYYHQREYQKAAEAFERIITILKKSLGPEHPNLAVAMGNYAIILTKLDRTDEAAQWAAKAEAIRAKRGPK